jgi:uncharacterized protein
MGPALAWCAYNAEMSELSPELLAKRDALVAWIGRFPRVWVAYSGGVDSAVVAKAAQVALGKQAIAVTAVSASLASGELEAARRIVAQIGIEHRVIETTEFGQAGYVRNAPDRCYYCKTELYSQLERLAEAARGEVLLNGANLDDRGDHRPGMKAAQEHQVYSPLLECGLTKADVRGLAAAWGLEVWDKPASPCLSSRIAYGEEVTPERVAMVDGAEQFLKGLGLVELRVRYHKGDLARIEVPASALVKLADADLREQLVKRFRELGFKFVTLDLEGFRSGSLNTLVASESLQILG